jgi:hypothetical protein
MSHTLLAIYLGTLIAALSSTVIVNTATGGLNFQIAEAVVACDGHAATIIGTGGDDRLRG